MSVRKAAVLASAAALVAGVTPLLTSANAGVAVGAASALTLPKAGCFDIKDPAGDAQIDGRVPNDPDLDILGVAFQTTSTDFRAFIKVAQLKDGPATTDGHRFAVYFDFADNQFALSGSHYSHGTGAIRDGLAQTGQAGHVTQLGINVPSLTAVPPATSKGFVSSGLTYTFDTAHSWVIADLPLADIKKNAGGKKFAGRILGVGVSAGIDEYAVSSVADTTESGNSNVSYTSAFVVGQNKCFAPPAKKKRK